MPLFLGNFVPKKHDYSKKLGPFSFFDLPHLELYPPLNISASNATCTLSWNAIPGATGYDIYRNGSWYRWTNALTTADTGLSNGTTYTYTVAAENDTTNPVDALGLPLLTNPDLVAQDTSVPWKTALWFWNTQTVLFHG